MFFDLPGRNERLSFLWFADWFNHNFINRSRQPLVPGNYRTMEEWEHIFNRIGFKVLKKEHLGFASIGSLHPVNRGFFVLEKVNSKDLLRDLSEQALLDKGL